LNFDNGHRPRQGQHNNNNNKNRNRGRNNRRPGGGGGNSPNNGGGNPLNRVYESNGPDIKVRGTAQTIAEKYLQLGRDSQSSGDNVMAESYFQFSEHYFRVWAAAQPVGQPTQQLRRPDDEEYEEDREESAEGDAEGSAPVEGEQSVSGDQPMAAAEGSSVEQQDGERSDQRNTNRQRDNRDRFRPRWQNRRDQQTQDQPRDGDTEPRVMDADAQQPREAVVEARQPEPEDASGKWEAPSFLRRPAAVVEEVADEPVAEKRTRAPRRPRAVQVDDAVKAEETTPDE
jgi:Domain of unknown function (DUF4167)